MINRPELVYGKFLKQLSTEDISNLFTFKNNVFGYLFKQYISFLGYPDIGGAIRFPKVMKRLDPKPGEHILDIGCGRGFYSHAIAEFGASVTGIDDGPFVEIAQMIGCKLRNTVKIIRGDIAHLNFSPHYFDKIICIEVLEHLLEDERIFSEWCQLLKPGGRMIFSVPLATDQEIKSFVPDLVNDPYGHKRAGYSLNKITELCERNHMKIFEFEAYCGRLAFSIRMALAKYYKKNKWPSIITHFPIWLWLWQREKVSTTKTDGFHLIIMTLEKNQS